MMRITLVDMTQGLVPHDLEQRRNRFDRVPYNGVAREGTTLSRSLETLKARDDISESEAIRIELHDL